MINSFLLSARTSKLEMRIPTSCSSAIIVSSNPLCYHFSKCTSLLISILDSFPGVSAGYPRHIIPTGLTCFGSWRIYATLSSLNASTKAGPIPSFTAGALDMVIQKSLTDVNPIYLIPPIMPGNSSTFDVCSKVFAVLAAILEKVFPRGWETHLRSYRCS